MRKIQFVSVLVVGVCGLFIFPSHQLRAAGEADSVNTALAELQQWLGDEENGKAWNKYLLTPKLRQQIKRGDDADRKILRNVLQKYTADHQGLDMWRFVAVRDALNSWLDALPAYAIEDLPELARDAKQHFHEVTEEDVDKSLADLKDAIAGLDNFLAGGSKINTMRWKHFLHWDEMQDQLQGEGKPDWRELQAITEHFRSNVNGVELPEFVAVRDALNEYISRTVFANPKSQDYYERYLDDLADRLEAYNKQPNAEDAIIIGKTLGWLERFGQADDLVAAVRHYYWKPNLFLQVSEHFLNAGVETDVEEDTSVSEVILGTSIYGSAHMEGRLGLELIPNDEHATFSVTLNGTTWSNNVGYNGPVTVYSTGTTGVSAAKHLHFKPDGLTADAAQATCSTSSSINSIAANLNLVRNIAWNRARQSKSQVERIASQRAAARVAGKMDVEVADLLERGNDAYNDRVRLPLIRRDAFPPLMKLRTTTEFLRLRMMQAMGDHLAAPDAPPETADGQDIQVRVHESMVANMTQAAIGNVTITDERAQRMIEDLTGSVPEELAIDQDDDPWSITFASERPVDARFDDNTMQLTIRAKRFTRADQVVKKSLEISATYKLRKTPEGVNMIRQGDVDVEYARGGRESVAEVALKTFIKRKFEGVFKPEIISDGIELKGRWADAGKLRLKHLHCDGGWLGLGWKIPSATARTARLEETVQD